MRQNREKTKRVAAPADGVRSREIIKKYKDKKQNVSEASSISLIKLI